MVNFEVNLGKKYVYYFTYKYNNNICSVNSCLVNGNDKNHVEYLTNYCYYAKESYYLASCMLTIEQRTEVGELMLAEESNGQEVYKLIESYSFIGKKDV